MENTNSENSESTIDDLINEIKSKSEDGDYIYRGERKKHYKISSALYREYFDNEDINVDFEGFDLRAVQRGMLTIAKKHVGEPPQGLFDDSNVSRWAGLARLAERRPIIDSDELEILRNFNTTAAQPT